MCLTLAFPDPGWWPLAPVGVAGLTLAARGRRPRFGALLGLITGLCLFIPVLHWSGLYVGALPWLALATVEALYLAGMGALMPWAWRAPGGSLGTTVAVAGLWVAQEAVRGRVPFGGFPWARLAFSQADTPMLRLAALGGAPLVSAAVAATGALIAIAVVTLIERREGRGAGRRILAAGGLLAVAVLLVLAGSAVPITGGGDRQIQVAAVQGNVPQLGLEFNARRRAVLDDHANATLGLAARVRAGQAPAPDLVLWPENSSDIDPLRNPDAAQVISTAADRIGAPILVGAVLEAPGDRVANAAIVWGPSGSAAPGPGEEYIKRHPAPFGEYIPYRSFFRHFSGKVDLVARDFIAGRRPGVLNVGGARLGDVICFEVAYDGLVRDTVRGGAQLIVVQTNNATFGLSDESVQQLAMSRLRAVESGRAVVHISTVGVSALIRPDGSVQDRSRLFTQDVLEARLPLRTAAHAGDPGRVLAGGADRRGRAGAGGARRDVADALTPAGRGGRAGPARGRPPVTGEDAREIGMHRVLVAIPTYNEAENLPVIVARTRAAVPAAHILVADDNSPDGTGEIADGLAGEDDHVHVVHRPGKRGLGAAYLDAFGWGLQRGFDVLVEMDADGSHQPEQLPSLLARIDDGADVVLGSRWVPGGAVRNWSLGRTVLSRGGNTYVRFVLGIPVRDATGGFRAYRATALKALDLGDVASQGYCFQVDLVWRAVRAGLRVEEVPITFVDREQGESKMNRAIVGEALWRVTQWGVQQRTERVRHVVRARSGTR